MSRSWVLVSAVCALSLGLASLSGRAAAAGSPIAESMGDLRWGMTENEVISHVKAKLADRYAERIKKERSEAKKEQLKGELRRMQTEVSKSLVNFEGSSRYDRGVIAGEFAHDNGESMISYKDESSENYYFFMNGRLWKWHKAFGTSTFGGSGGFKKFSKSIEKKFGKGRAKTGALNAGQSETQWLEYLDRNSRLRAADNSKNGSFSLIFEEMATVRSLASLRPNQAPAKRSPARDDYEEPASTSRTEVAAVAKRKSLFASEPQQETEAQYRERQRREAAESRRVQEAMHSRKQEAKKGEALKTLEGLDDKDPLGGL